MPRVDPASCVPPLSPSLFYPGVCHTKTLTTEQEGETQLPPMPLLPVLSFFFPFAPRVQDFRNTRAFCGVSPPPPTFFSPFQGRRGRLPDLEPRSPFSLLPLPFRFSRGPGGRGELEGKPGDRQWDHLPFRMAPSFLGFPTPPVIFPIRYLQRWLEVGLKAF